MNRINNVFNKNEIENKLKDFKEGKDYSVSPTDEPKIKTYNFHNDKLRSMFRSDRVPVRVTREAYDGKDYKYKGHFEEGKDYNYSAQQWLYDENYQGDRGTDLIPDNHFAKGFMNGIKWDEHSRVEVHGESGNFHTGQKYWEGHWIYRGKGNKNQEPKKIENGLNDGFFLPGNFKNDEEIKYQERLNGSRLRTLERDKKEFEEKLTYYESLPAEERKDKDTLSLKDKVNFLRKEVEEERDWINRNNIRQKGRMGRNEEGKLITNKEDNNSNLQKENQELRQELAEVKDKLAQVLEELKKLKSNTNGKDSEKLNQQITHNEKLIKESENISLSEVQEQVNKSEALMKEVNTTGSLTKDDNKDGNGSLPYVVGGSVILVSAGIIGYFLLKKNRGKKVV